MRAKTEAVIRERKLTQNLYIRGSKAKHLFFLVLLLVGALEQLNFHTSSLRIQPFELGLIPIVYL